MRHPGHIPPHPIPRPSEAWPLPITSLREPATCDALGACQHPMQCSGRSCYRDIVTPEPDYSTALMNFAQAGNYFPDIAPANIAEPDERSQPRPNELPATTVPSPTPFLWLGLLVTVPWIILLGMGAGYVWEKFGPAITALLGQPG